MSLKLLATSAIILCAGTANAADKWAPTFELEGRTNSDRSLASPKLLIPLAQDDNSMLFTDIRSRFDDHDSEEYNIGVGYRSINNGWIYGGYVFADYLSSSNNNKYWQGTAGFEMLSEDWDLRVNGYLPEGTEHVLSSSAGGLTVDSSGNFAISNGFTTKERALPGLDAEVGYKIPIDEIDLRLFGGAYYFEADEFDNVAGPKARIELTLNEDNTAFLSNGMEFTFGAQYQNDGPREGTTTALAEFRIPFGYEENHSKLSPLEKRMTNFIERDVDIVAGSATSGGGVAEAAQVTVNGNNYTEAAIIDGNTTNVQAAFDNTGTASLVILDGTYGDVNTGGGLDLHLFSGKELVGGGQAITITGLTSNIVTSGVMPGARGTLVGDIAFGGSNNVRVTGIDIEGGSTAIVMNQSESNIALKNVNINSTGNGIYAVATNNISLENMNITTQFTAVYTNSSNNFSVNNVTIDAGTAAFYIEGNTNLSGAGNTITRAGMVTCYQPGAGSSGSISYSGGSCP